MRNASHRSICRLRRAARRVGGHRRGWRGETLARGAPLPAPLLSCALGKMLSLEPTPGHSLPQSWVHTTFCSTSGCPLAFWGPGFSVLLCPPASLCLPAFPCGSTCLSLSTSFLSFWVCCLFLPLCRSVHECLPISFSALLSVSACASCTSLPPVFFLSAPWVLFFFKYPSSLLHLPLLSSLDLSAIPLSHCPSVHMVPVSVPHTICTQVFSAAQTLFIQQQSP